MTARAGADQLVDHLGVQRGAARGDPFQRVGEVAGVHHPLLEQVADPGRAAGQQSAGVLGLHVLGEDQHRQARLPLAQLDRGAQALVGVGRRHPDVGDHDVRTVLGDGGEQLLGVRDGGEHLVPLVLQQLDQSGPQDGGVLRDDDAHGV